MKTYIHYGSKVYDVSLVTKGLSVTSKPNGLWGTPEGNNYTWRDCCKANGYKKDVYKKDDFFRFTLSKEARILNIHKEEDIVKYIIPGEFRLKYTLTSIGDTLKIDELNNDYDAMEIYYEDDYDAFRCGYFYLYDLSSIVVWNPDVIKIL